jgi:predicted dehydrogenase
MTDEKKKSTQVSRRQFVGTVATAAGVTIVPRHVLGAGFQAPSDTVNVAIVGYAHGMGTNNLLNVAKSDNLVALCDCDESDAAKEALKRRGTLEKFPKAVQHKDYRVMLEKQKDIDAVLIATPDHTHAMIAMAAMQLGKHVYVQKPLTRTIGEARALTEAARKYKVVTQMGNQGHSEEGLRLMQEWLDAGAIGQVREVHCWTNRPIWPQGMPRPTDTQAVPTGLDWELWIGPAPMRPFHKTYHPFGWRAWQDFGAGAMGDMACHVMDASFTILKLGAPSSVIASLGYNFLPPAPGQRGFGQRVEYNDSYPPSSTIHLSFPASGLKISNRIARCPSRAPSSSATRARCGAKPTPRARASSRSRPCRPSSVRRGRCRGYPKGARATNGTGWTRSDRRVRPCRISTTPGRSPRPCCWATSPCGTQASVSSGTRRP